MKLARSFVAIMAIASLTACDDEDGGTDPEPNIAGTYTVSEFRYTADSGAPSVDLASIPAGSGGPYGILSMTVAADNSFEGSLKLPTAGGPMTFDIGGDIELDGDDITIDFDAATEALGVLDPEESGTYAMAGNTLSITLPDVTFNFGSFGGADEDVDANLEITGTRS